MLFTNIFTAEFMNIFIPVYVYLLLFLAVSILLYSLICQKIKQKAKPVHYISYKKGLFNTDFTFLCESCGATVSTRDAKCPKCDSAYGKNKEYKEKKQEMNRKYLRYLQEQEDAIADELEYIKNTKAAMRASVFSKHSRFNYELGHLPVYKPAEAYDFTCEYCDNRLRGKSTDECGCSHCGASYRENLELLVREEEDRLEKCHYDEYMQLKDWEWQQNIKNEQRDAYIETKHKKKIDFMMGYGKYIALAIIVGMIFVAMGITVVWLKLQAG